ncbi:MAG TPA: ATP-binding protein [Thermoanaerobaculia bacterium]|nr:ATP-binding protein [Thermoanaerobaculia bacterium]
MGLRETLARRSRDARWVAGTLAVILAALVTVSYLIQRGRELPETLVANRVLLFALSYLVLVLIAVILFVLARNLFKLWLERRHRVLGSRFRTKLVATYVGLSLVPVLALFFFANELLQGAIDRWFSTSLANVVEQGNALAQTLQRTIEDRNYRDAARLAAEFDRLDLADPAGRAEAARRLAVGRSEIGADFVALYDRDDFVHALLDPRTGIADLPEPGRSLPREAADTGRSGRILEPPGSRGRLILAAATPGGRPGGRAVVIVGTLLDPTTAGGSEELIRAYQAYRQLEVQKREFKQSYVLMFILITLLILLASSWTGLFLARRLMEPVQAFAEAMQKVSTGDLDQRIDVPADDEMARVVETFNRMTEELARSRDAVERSHRELTEANRTLDEERALVRAILESLAAGVIALDGEDRVLAANAAAAQMLRLRDVEQAGGDLVAALGADSRAPLAELLRANRPGAGRITEQVSFAVGGTWRTFEARVAPLPGSPGGRQGRVIVLEDLTELIRAQKLATWTEAARRVAHEIKNPLTPIRLAAERLRARHREGGGDTAELVERSVDIIVREVGNMQQLVDEFSRFARLPGAQLAATELAPLVADVARLYHDLKPGVEIRAEVEPGLGQIWVDPEQIRRVLINLLDNAVEATDPPGTVSVAARRDDGSVELTVSDTGRGIAPEDRDKLFLPFFSRKGRGSGLGLAIVHRAVTDHDGSIAVEDNRPHGTIFRVRIPARGAPDEASGGDQA